LDKETIEYMKKYYDTKDLVDVQNIKFNDELINNKMLEEYLMKVKNLYHFKSGNVEVEIIYSSISQKTVSEVLKEYLLRER